MARRLVIGPPCGGKTTYIAEHKKSGDVVIDMDRMASALAGDDEVTYDHPEHIVRLAAAAHYRVRRVASRLSSVDIWLIYANPGEFEVEQFRAQGWEVVTLDPGRAVVEERCARLRPAKALQWIDEWYAERSDGVA